MLNGSPPPVESNLYRRHRIRIKEVMANDGAQYLNKTITVAGWCRTTRNANKGQLLFVELNDGSTGQTIQCVLDSEKTEGFAECKASGGTGASFQMVGTLIESQGDGQAVELAVTTGKLLGAVYGGNFEGTEVGGKLYPMSKKAHTLEHMREHAHLRPRARLHAAAMRIRHSMAYATHTFFHPHQHRLPPHRCCPRRAIRVCVSFASLYQVPRTKEQDTIFSKALPPMNQVSGQARYQITFAAMASALC